MRLLLRKLRAFWALPRSERRIFLEAAVALPLIGLGLRLVRISTLLSWIERVATRRAAPIPAEDRAAKIERTRWLLGAAGQNGLYQGSCLSRSATLWWLLRRRGVESDLRVGVRKQGDDLHAHAWLECGGVVINDRSENLERYSPFAETLTR